MYARAEMYLCNFIPEEITEGMMFMRMSSRNTIADPPEVYFIKKIPNDFEKFLEENGLPVELQFYFPGKRYPFYEGKPWVDDNDEYLHEITEDEINQILQNEEWGILVDIREDCFPPEPIFNDNKPVIVIT